MHRPLTSLLACPSCSGPLASQRLPAGAGVLRCVDCGPYPVLAGVPVLVPSPSAWCAAYHDAALAALASRQLATPPVVRVLEDFAAAAADEEPRRFGNDWTPEEARGEAPVPLHAGEAGAVLSALREARGPRQWLAARVGPDEALLEVGCGAGPLKRTLGRRRGVHVVMDLSLEAVLTAAVKGVHGVVGDACALPFRDGAFTTVVAENVIDLLDEPHAFATHARRVAARLLLSTPDPSLGTHLDEALEALLSRQGLEVVARADGLPWTRTNSPRFVETYLCLAVEAHARRKKHS